MTCMVVRKESEEMESGMVKMEGPKKSVKLRNKTCKPKIYVNYKKKTFTYFSFHFPLTTFLGQPNMLVFLFFLLRVNLRVNCQR